MEPIQYIRAIRRRWVTVVGAVVVAAAAAALVSRDPTPIEPSAPFASFAATTTVYDYGLATGTSNTVFPLTTLPRIIELPDVAAAAAEHVGADADPAAIASQITAFADPESGFLDLTAVGGTARQAERISWAYWQGLEEYLTDEHAARLDVQLDGLRTSLALAKEQGDPLAVAAIREQLIETARLKLAPITLSVLQAPLAAEVSIEGFRPPTSVLVRVGLAALLGLLAGLALALVLERFDTRIRTRQRAEEHFDLPVVAEIPVIKRSERGKVSVAVNPTGKAADAFRLLGASVGGAWASMGSADANGNGHGNGRPGSIPNTILVTSPGPGDGKTTVAANLAAVFGEMGRQVFLISCDLRRPSIHRMFSVTVSPGLTDMLTSPSPIALVPVPTDVPNVSLVPSGRSPVSPGELLGSDRMQQVLEIASHRADVVILDCSPVLVASDIAALLPHVDVVLLVGRADRTRADLAERTSDVLRRLAAPVIGVALNAAHEITMPSSYKRYYKPTKAEVRAREAARSQKGSSGGL